MPSKSKKQTQILQYTDYIQQFIAINNVDYLTT